jgi:predicted RNA-binding protein
MCESSVFLEEGGELKQIMEEASKLVIEGDNIICYGLLGDKKEVPNAAIKEANLMDHKIILHKI